MRTKICNKPLRHFLSDWDCYINRYLNKALVHLTPLTYTLYIFLGHKTIRCLVEVKIHDKYINFLWLLYHITIISWSKTIQFIISQFCRPEVQHRSPWAKLKVSARLHFLLEAVGENPFPCSFGLLARFNSLYLQDWGHHFLAAYQIMTILASRGQLH